MSNATPIALPWHRREDTWAIFIALGLVLAVTTGFFLGASPFVGATALTIPTWSGSLAKVTATFAAQPAGPIALFAVFLLAFSAASAVIGWDVGKYAAGFALLFVFSIVVTVLGSNQTLKQWQLETPLLALAVGMLLGNSVALPGWFQSALRTEFYVKVGIILLGATLPFTIILQAGPLAIAQATIVAVITFATIYFAATRLFGLDPRFGATLGAGGSICGVSAAIAIGGACRAEKSHVSVAISMVILWAVAMIFVLPFWARSLGLEPGVAGAWIGTSEFADAAGFAAASAVGDERAVKTFTLMKVVGRDMFVGVWALVVALLSVTIWDKKKSGEAERVDVGEIWRRFPKFILGLPGRVPRRDRRARVHRREERDALLQGGHRALEDPSRLGVHLDLPQHRVHHAVPGAHALRLEAVRGVRGGRDRERAARLLALRARVRRATGTG